MGGGNGEKWGQIGGGGGWHKPSVSDCLPLAAPIGLSPLLILTLCGPERNEGGGMGKQRTEHNLPFWDHKWLKTGSKQIQKDQFFHARVGEKKSCAGYTNAYASFAWHNVVVGIACLLGCPLLSINILVFCSRFTAIP